VSKQCKPAFDVCVKQKGAAMVIVILSVELQAYMLPMFGLTYTVIYIMLDGSQVYVE
jgi:hypothetical protein